MIFTTPSPAPAEVSPAYNQQPTTSIWSVDRIVTLLLLISFLQPWKLAASTPGAEDFFKHVTEEGALLIDEVIGEKASFNHHPPLNVEQRAAQTAPHIAEERAIVEPSPMDTQNLGNQILALPAGIIFNFLRSSEAKQATYKADHQQAVQELQEKYPAFAQKIAIWKQALEEWSNCPISAEKEIRYQQVEALVPDMPPELYRLVALSQAMKIIEDTIAYIHYLPLAWEKYEKLFSQSTEAAMSIVTPELESSGMPYTFRALCSEVPCQSSASATLKTGFAQNTETEEAKIAEARNKIILLAQIDIINNNIENSEKAADAIIRLSEQRNRCFTSAAAIKITEVKTAISFNTAARSAEEAITSYCQFGQKMKEGDIPAASLLRIKGLSLACNALEKDYHAQATTEKDSMKADYFSNAAYYVSFAEESLKNAAQANSKGKIEIVQAFEQAALYHTQAALIATNGDSTAADYFSSTAFKFFDAAKARSEGKVESAKVLEQAAQYYFQAAQAAVNEDSAMANYFSSAALSTSDAAEALNLANQAKNDNNIEIAKAYEQVAQYRFQRAQAALNGDNTQADYFSNIDHKALHVAETLKMAAQARSKDKVEAAKVLEQASQYYFQATQAIASGNSAKAKNFSSAAYHAIHAAEALENAAQAKSEGKVEDVKAFEQAALYYCQAAQFAFKGDNTEAENFSSAGLNTVHATLKNAVQSSSGKKYTSHCLLYY
ncbi:MAG TPA: hypothetical protein VJK54_11730 [Chthoniobacterales bacterium]|nr:hypothetical protein [Chthoniobacterales bacterium]